MIHIILIELERADLLLPDIEAEFSNAKHGRGAVSMARAQNPNSANSQFFICFKDASFLRWSIYSLGLCN